MAGQLLLANPRKRKSAPKRRRRRALSSVTKRSTTRRYRKNPIGGGKIVDDVVSAAIGAGGALAVDFAMQKMPFIPAQFTTGPMGAATKGVIALGIGMLVGKVGKKRKLGSQLAAGGMTVAAYEAIKSTVGPSIGLSALPSGGNLLGEYYPSSIGNDGMGEYFEDGGMGYTAAGETFESEFDF